MVEPKTGQHSESVAVRQEESSKGLANAMRVTTQVTEQLTTGATAVDDVARKLEQVVNQPCNVVGIYILRAFSTTRTVRNKRVIDALFWCVFYSVLMELFAQ